MKLSVSTDPGTKLSEISKRFGISAEVGFRFSQDSPEVTLVFPSVADQHRELHIFLQEFDAVEHMGVWRIRRKVEKAIKQLEYVRSILECPSVVLVSSWLSDGVYHIEFIFHRSDLARVSSILMEAVRETGKMGVDYLGPSFGFRETLLSVNARTDLSVFEIGLSPPEEEMIPENNPLGDRWTRIAKIPYGADRINAVYFVTGKPQETDGICTISDGKLYQAVTRNAYVDFMNRCMNDSRILSVARIHEFKRPDFTISLMLPRLMSQEFLSLITASEKEMQEWKPVLRSLMGIGEWMDGPGGRNSSEPG